MDCWQSPSSLTSRKLHTMPPSPSTPPFHMLNGQLELLLRSSETLAVRFRRATHVSADKASSLPNNSAKCLLIVTELHHLKIWQTTMSTRRSLLFALLFSFFFFFLGGIYNIKALSLLCVCVCVVHERGKEAYDKHTLKKYEISTCKPSLCLCA